MVTVEKKLWSWQEFQKIIVVLMPSDLWFNFILKLVKMNVYNEIKYILLTTIQSKNIIKTFT